MLATVRDQNSVLNWIGTATDFLEDVGTEAGKKVTASAGWPKAPRRLMDELRRRAGIQLPARWSRSYEADALARGHAKALTVPGQSSLTLRVSVVSGATGSRSLGGAFTHRAP